MDKKSSPEELLKQKGYKLTSEFLGTKKPVDVECLTCGKKEIQIAFRTIMGRLGNPACPDCKNNTIRTERINKINSSEGGYKFKEGQIEDGRAEIILICPNGNDYKTIWYNFDTYNYRCPCGCKGRRNKRYTTEEVREHFFKTGDTF